MKWVYIVTITVGFWLNLPCPSWEYNIIQPDGVDTLISIYDREMLEDIVGAPCPLDHGRYTYLEYRRTFDNKLCAEAFKESLPLYKGKYLLKRSLDSMEVNIDY